MQIRKNEAWIALTGTVLVFFITAIVAVSYYDSVAFAQAAACKTIVSKPDPATVVITHKQPNDGSDIQRRINGGPWETIDKVGPNTLSWSDSSLKQGNEDLTYEYQVRDFDKTRVSPWSNVGCKTVLALPLLAPIIDVR